MAERRKGFNHEKSIEGDVNALTIDHSDPNEQKRRKGFCNVM